MVIGLTQYSGASSYLLLGLTAQCVSPEKFSKSTLGSLHSFRIQMRKKGRYQTTETTDSGAVRGKPASVRKADPVISYQFSIDISGAVPINGYFSEISGLDSEYDTIEHKTVNALGMQVIQQVPGRQSYSNVTLKRGLTSSMGFWMWHEGIALGLAEALRASVSITMYDRKYDPLVQWDLVRAWPAKVSGPQINADSNDIAVEELTLVHEGMSRTFMTAADSAFSWLRRF